MMTMTLAEGDLGTLQTLQVMRDAVNEAVKGLNVLKLAARINRGGGDLARLFAIYSFLLAPAFRFVADPDGVELLRHPNETAAEILTHGYSQGDCDDRAMLGAAIAKAMGFRVGLMVASNRPSGEFHHVLFGAWIGPTFVPVDPQERFFNRLPSLTRAKILEV